MSAFAKKIPAVIILLPFQFLKVFKNEFILIYSHKGKLFQINFLLEPWIFIFLNDRICDVIFWTIYFIFLNN